MRKEKGEMEVFLGCLLVIGIVRLPGIKHYWNASSRLFANIGIQELSSLQRFYDITPNYVREDVKID